MNDDKLDEDTNVFKINDKVILKDISEEILTNDNYFNKWQAARVKENYEKGYLVVSDIDINHDSFLNVGLYDALFDKDDCCVCGLIENDQNIKGKSFEEIKNLLFFCRWFNDSQLEYFEYTSVQLSTEAFEDFLQ